MLTFRSVCLLFQIQRVVLPQNSAIPPIWRSSRSVSTAQLRRRKPARMTLSPDVAQSSVRYGEERKRSTRFKNSPFGGMNQTHARLRDNPRSKSDAETKRSYSGKDNAPSRKTETPLFKALKMQTALSPVSYAHRTSIKARIADIKNFDQFDLLPTVRDSIYANALSGLTDVMPTPIQRLAIPALLKHSIPKSKQKIEDDGSAQFDQYLLAAETGSGKTLGYLLPILDNLKRAEFAQKEEEDILARERQRAEEEREKTKQNVFELESPEVTTRQTSTVARPKAIILVPTSELVTQVGRLVKQLAHTVKYRSALISSAHTPRKIGRNLFAPGGIDILVATPHLLASIAQTNPYILSRVTHLVVDEADSLLDRSFSPMTTSIVDKSAPSLQQLVLCSATIPRSLDSFLRKRFPEIRRLVTPNLHAIPRRVQLGVIDVDKDPYHGNKSLACADIIWSLGKAGGSYDSGSGYLASSLREPKGIIVFVNERESAQEVARYLVSKDIDAVALSRDTPEERQSEILAEFTVAKLPPSLEDIKMAKNSKRFRSDAGAVAWADSSQTKVNSKRLPDTKVLVTTDLGSRGIDTIAVKTVILHDVPHSTVDFIHRLGRTGRMGRRGRGIILVGKKDRKDVVKEVREAMFRGQALI